MATLDGAIIRIVSDGKRRTIKDIRYALRDTVEFYEHYHTPKSTLWYHLLKLCREGMIKSWNADGKIRVLYAKV